MTEKINELDTQIARWKKLHGEVYAISVNDDEGIERTAYFKKPDLKAISAASKFAQEDPIKSGLVMFDACLLGGDDEFNKNDEFKLAAIVGIGKISKVREETIKKL